MVAVLSGGNIDPLLLLRVIRHGLAAAGRYLSFRCRHARTVPARWPRCWPSSPSSGANVLDVMHERVAARLHVDEVEVLLQLETRGPDHSRGRAGPPARAGLHPHAQLGRP